MEIARHWRLQTARYSLIGEICGNCTTKIFPPRDICHHCGDEAKTPFQFSGKGEVYSYTIVRDAPAGFEENAPYTIAIIRLEEGPMITAQLTDIDNDQVGIGMSVEMVTRKIKEDGEKGILVYGYKFRPVLALSSK